VIEMTKKSLFTALRAHPLLLDGAAASQLSQQGLRAGDCPEEWNRTHPRTVAAIHQAFVEAGAQVVTTNSLGANRVGLNRYGLANQVFELNLSAAQIARESCPSDIYVAGSVGPTGEMVTPSGRLTFEKLVSVFQEQIAGLVEGGVDLICVENMSQLHEARAAVIAAKRFPRIPVLVTMIFTFSPTGFRTTMNVDPQSAVLELEAAGANAIGCSCGQLTAKQMARLVARLKKLTKLPIVAQLDPGKPNLRKGLLFYSRTPQQLAQGAREVLQAGADIVGGSWGTTPSHIAAIAESIPQVKKTARRRTSPGTKRAASKKGSVRGKSTAGKKSTARSTTPSKSASKSKSKARTKGAAAKQSAAEKKSAARAGSASAKKPAARKKSTPRAKSTTRKR
jgi:5-methyltetrahydrofolate--homocysteine methyltransferase